MAKLSEDEIASALSGLKHWRRSGDEIAREFDCGDFVGAVEFVNRILPVAEGAGHHPDLAISWKNVRVSLSTHSEGGLTARDFSLARSIDELG